MMKNNSNFPNKNVGSALSKLTKSKEKSENFARRRHWWLV